MDVENNRKYIRNGKGLKFVYITARDCESESEGKSLLRDTKEIASFKLFIVSI